ncbi:unnamed protein product [Rotaria socialis]|uniref:Uncharacterized protein n=1 Tax=Rotaria socialis TaxID=392032 RepID=A0A820P0V1_9BILA|nr:unnamed protein product [Rotaria socialis]CAF4396532.1 unnamed protein product [Rotaria socialis]
MGVENSQPRQNQINPATPSRSIEPGILESGQSSIVMDKNTTHLTSTAPGPRNQPIIGMETTQNQVLHVNHRIVISSKEAAQCRQSKTDQLEALEKEKQSIRGKAGGVDQQVTDEQMLSNEDVPKDSYKMPIIWLDMQVHDNQDNIELQTKLKLITNFFTPFNNDDECEEYVRNLGTTKGVILIVAGSIGSSFIPLVHDSIQINVIYIYSLAQEYYKKKFSKYEKVCIFLSHQY